MRWLGGSQPYDGKLLSSGATVDQGLAPRDVFVEITTSTHQKAHLVREVLHERGFSFGAKGMQKHPKTGDVESTPYAEIGDSRQADLAAQIIARLQDKSAKGYPPDTVLIIYCVPNGPLSEEEWKDAVARVERSQPPHTFSEVFLVEPTIGNFSATIYGT